jgi:hypothetical protein
LATMIQPRLRLKKNLSESPVSEFGVPFQCWASG